MKGQQHQQFISEDVAQECRRRLLMMKQEIMNRFRTARQNYAQTEHAKGDEIDQTVAQQEEHSFLVNQERLRNQLLEIEMALGRIEQGIFGVCEETEEKIETDRLLAVPWTRLSIEGAELREAMNRKYAR
jgi:DnaK suppressor protein